MDSSPLARLPAEIRDAIYTLVLGGQDIHVRNTGTAVSYSICTEPITHRERVVALKENDSDGLYFPEELDHYNCATHGLNVKPSPTRLNLALLLVCQDIHREAALVPFKTNTFVVSNVRQLQHFGNGLLEFQRLAVSSVCLVTSYVDSLPWNARAGPHVLALEGPLHLIVVVGVAHRTSMEKFQVVPAGSRAKLYQPIAPFGGYPHPLPELQEDCY